MSFPFMRHTKKELNDLRKLLYNAGVNTTNTNTYSNLRRKARQVISNQYHSTGTTLSWLNFHNGTIKKLTAAVANKINQQRNENLRNLKRYAEGKPVFISGRNNTGHNQTMTNKDRNAKLKQNLKEWENKKKAILRRYPNDPNFSKFRVTNPAAINI